MESVFQYASMLAKKDNFPLNLLLFCLFIVALRESFTAYELF